MNSKISLYLIGGFLGAGKTTFIRSLMESMADKKLGLLVNEFGSVGIDGTVLDSDGVQLVEINNGSIFCACIKDGFVRTLKEFSEKPIDVLLIENSGMADPAGMRNILSDLKPYLGRGYDYKGLITLVDCVTFLAYSEILLPVKNQVAEADFIIVNKTDMADSKKIEEIHQRIREYNRTAEIIDTVYAHIELPLPDMSPTQGKSELQTSNTPYSRPKVYTLETCDDADIIELSDFCDSISPCALRIKGFVRNDGNWIHVDSGGYNISVALADSKLKIRLERGKIVIIGMNGRDIYDKILDAWKGSVGTDCKLTEG